MKKNSNNIKAVLEILKDEVDGKVTDALRKMSSRYSQTWMYQAKNKIIFPSDTSTGRKSMQEIYHIKGREYHIYNITESENVVMVECVELYPDEVTGKVYRTPEILVIEFENGKIKRGRHYCDPRISYLDLTEKVLKMAYQNKKPIMVIR